MQNNFDLQIIVQVLIYPFLRENLDYEPSIIVTKCLLFKGMILYLQVTYLLDVMRHCGLLLDISDTQMHVHTTHYLPTIPVYHVMFAHVQAKVYNYLTPATGKASGFMYHVSWILIIWYIEQQIVVIWQIGCCQFIRHFIMN